MVLNKSPLSSVSTALNRSLTCSISGILEFRHWSGPAIHDGKVALARLDSLLGLQFRQLVIQLAYVFSFILIILMPQLLPRLVPLSSASAGPGSTISRKIAASSELMVGCKSQYKKPDYL